MARISQEVITIEGSIASDASHRNLIKLAEQRAHLDLKVTLMTEQKTAKLIDLMEELRRDLPDVLNRHDPRRRSCSSP